jgi:uncharacterized protein YggT (Ycf19 family)
MTAWIVLIINYTLSFILWMIIGRHIVELFARGKANIILNIFIKVTEPYYNIIKRVFPFAKGAWIPVLSIVTIIILRIMLIAVFGTGLSGQELPGRK